jgi:fructuronate reductase
VVKNISNTPLNPSVITPSYDRSTLKTRIVHLGFGAFHRAHQALYTSEMIEKTGSDWGICEIDLFGDKLIQQLRKQDHLYSVLEKNSDSNTAKISGSVIESLHPKLDSKQAVLNKMAEPQVAIVSMTITEKGYCADLSSGRLDFNNALIVADLADPQNPSSAIGYIVEALRMRRAASITPFTVMSCDNIQENSHVAKQVVLDYANKLDTELGTWIEQNVTFPCTMVDRIVPAITDNSLAEISESLGVEDLCGIACEPFRQWVIEDNFVNGRPEWDAVGATFVADVVPFENMKLRMLNGSHSFLAYLGYLAGYRYIYQTMADDAFRQAAFQLMNNEQATTLSMPEGTDLAEYANLLISRFSNASVKHETWQIATDGSQKLPQRMCESLRFHIKNKTPVTWLVLGVAGWMVYIGEKDEKGDEIIVNDPMLEQFRTAYKNANTAEEIVLSLLGLSHIFGQDLIENKDFVAALITAVNELKTIGAKALVTKTLQLQAE